MILSPNFSSAPVFFNNLNRCLQRHVFFLALSSDIDDRKLEKDYKEVNESLAAMEVLFSYILIATSTYLPHPLSSSLVVP